MHYRKVEVRCLSEALGKLACGFVSLLVNKFHKVALPLRCLDSITASFLSSILEKGNIIYNKKIQDFKISNVYVSHNS